MTLRELVQAAEGGATRSTGPHFTIVLAGMKALLEHDIELNLVGDRFPEGVER